MATKKQKTVRINFYGIAIPENVANEYEDKALELLCDEKNEYVSISSGDYKVSKRGDYFDDGDLVCGSLVKTKTSELPSDFNVATGEEKPLGFGDDQGLGTPTHFLMDRSRGILMFQSGGVTMAQWLRFMEVNYKLQLESSFVVDPKNYTSVFKMTSISKIKVKAKKVKNIMQFPGMQSLFNPMKVGTELDGDYLEFVVGSNHSLKLAAAKQLIQSFINLNEDNKDSIIVEGKNEAEGKDEIFDLVTNRIHDQINIPKSKNLFDVPSNVIFELMLEKYKLLIPKIDTEFKWD